MAFLDDFRDLLLREPKHFAPRQDIENSDYTSFCYKVKNCYMCFASDYLEDCFHLYHSDKNKDCADGMRTWDSELCYECMDSVRFYNCDFCWDGVTLTDCFLCEDCKNCQKCFGCSGLRQAKYHIFNEKYSKDEYEKEVAKLKKQFFEEGAWFSEEDSPVCGEIMKKFNEVRYSVPHLHLRNIRCEDCYGDYCKDCKGCYDCFDCENCEDCLYLDRCMQCKDCADAFYIHQGELCYDCMSVAHVYGVENSFWILNSRDCRYGYCLHSCEHCFGCTNLKHKKFHILNEKFSEDEYFRRRDEIIEELKEAGIWGQNLIYLALKDVELGDPDVLG
jgi:hypothetical protein